MTKSFNTVLCLGAACTGCIPIGYLGLELVQLCLGAACTGCICARLDGVEEKETLPRRCLHGVHRMFIPLCCRPRAFASALPARGASDAVNRQPLVLLLCLGAACTGCIQGEGGARERQGCFASALPARGASGAGGRGCIHGELCLGAACTGCIRLGAVMVGNNLALPRRCLHGVHRQKPTNCGTPFCSIRRESVDSFSEINNKDSCADYFPALFCCQGDLHHHYRQPRTDNRPVLRCEQHRLFLFILSSHYRRLL